MVVKSLGSPLIATKSPTSPVKSTHHKKKESAEDFKGWKTTKAPTKQTAKTKAVKPLSGVVDRLTRNWVKISTSCMVIDCTNGTVSSGTPMLVLVYDMKIHEVAMSQVPEDLPQILISMDIPWGRQVDAPCSGRLYRWYLRTVKTHKLLRGREQAGPQWRG